MVLPFAPVTLVLLVLTLIALMYGDSLPGLLRNPRHMASGLLTLWLFWLLFSWLQHSGHRF